MHDLAIEHIKSGLSINTHFGCTLGCKYCVLTKMDKDSNTVEECLGISEIKDNKEILYKHFYVNDKTPIYINNRTDPFLPEVIDSTYEVLDVLCALKTKSPIMIITKLRPDKRITRYFDCLNVMFFYTYSGLPQGIDYNSNSPVHERNMEFIIKYVPFKNRFLYLRPIIPQLNDDFNILENIIKNVGVHFYSVVTGGIRVNDNNKELLGTKYEEVKEQVGFSHKYFVEELFFGILRIAEKYGVNIVRHTSCAIAIFLNEANKYHYFDLFEHCNKNCINKSICSNYEHKSNCKEFERWLEKQFEEKKEGTIKIVDEQHVVIHSSVSQELIAAARCAWGYHIIPDKVELCLSESRIVKREGDE